MVFNLRHIDDFILQRYFACSLLFDPQSVGYLFMYFMVEFQLTLMYFLAGIGVNRVPNESENTDFSNGSPKIQITFDNFILRIKFLQVQQPGKHSPG